MNLKKLFGADRQLIITYMRSSYLRVVNSTPNSEKARLEGLESNLLDCLSRSLNFTCDLREIEKGEYGMLLPNDSWTGAVGRLQRQTSDLALSELTDTFQRRLVIDFSEPYIKDTSNFFIRAETVARNSGVLFTSPFEYSVWFAIIVSFAFVLAFIYCLSRRNSSSIPTLFFYLFRIALNQGCEPRLDRAGSATSFVVCSWILYCCFVKYLYGDALTASTGVFIERKINTLDDFAHLLEREGMKIFVPEHNSLVDFMKNMPALPHGDLFRRRSEIRAESPTELSDIAHGRVAWPKSRIRTPLVLLGNGFPETKIRAVDEPLAHLNIAIGFRKNFTGQAAINWIIVALRESGCILKWQEDLMLPVEIQRLKDVGGSTPSYIRLGDLPSTFALLAGAYCLIVLLECLLSILRYSFRFDLNAFENS